MAKLVKCPFCGKEMTKGMIRGDAQLLDIARYQNVHACPECYEKLHREAKFHKERFSKKIENYAWERRIRLTEDLVASLYKDYLADYRCRKEALACDAPRKYGYFFLFDENGRFGVNEGALDFVGQDISAKDKLKTLKKAEDCEVFGFTAEDVGCLEFRLRNSEFIGLFKKCYSLEIRLNHEKRMTYRPVFVKTVVVGKGFAFGYRKGAKKQAIQLLESFRRAVGIPHPIREVKNFR